MNAWQSDLLIRGDGSEERGRARGSNISPYAPDEDCQALSSSRSFSVGTPMAVSLPFCSSGAIADWGRWWWSR